MEYLKLILIFAASAVIIKTVHEIRALIICAVITLAYLCVEYNLDYLKTGYLRIYNRGHGGMDNNGAGLMLAMAIPLFYFLFEALTSRWRWLPLLVIPAAVHAVQMSYSRGAMLSLIAILPLVVLRSRNRKWLLIGLLVFGPPLIYVTAGKQIRERFFSIATAEEIDESAKMRFMSWNAAIKIAAEHPIFGVGVRNSNLISYKYGADREGRTIHSTYLQIAADNGVVGLAIYLLMLLTVWREIRSVRTATRGLDDPESRLYYGLAAGVETSLAAFCFGSLFLSLEIFELPYMLLLCGSQLALLYAHRLGPIIGPLGYLSPPAQ
jgi:probable O-glycosylation ligase (exosortase A-associated)